MATCCLTTRWGGSIENPTVHDMTSALAELDRTDPEHPDCWLGDEEGWTISIFEDGLVVLENVETGEGPWHMRVPSRTMALDLWQLLQHGDLRALRANARQPGYGSD